MESPVMAPIYVAVHDGVGVFTKGQVIPNGTYDDEQLARLVGLGAIEPFDPPETDFIDGNPLPDEIARGQQLVSPSSLVPTSQEEYKDRLDLAAGAQAAGSGVATTTVLQTGDADYLASVDGLSTNARSALREGGFTTQESIDEASDEQLMALDGVGEGTVRTLRGR